MRKTATVKKRKPKVDLCSGAYTALRVGHTIVVTATGIHKTSGFFVFLEQNAMDIFPPQFSLWHKAPIGPVLNVITPFSVNAHFATMAPVKTVSVHDSAGTHAVRVESASEEVHAHALSSRGKDPRPRRFSKNPVAILAATSALLSGSVQVWAHLELILKTWSGAGSVFPSDDLESLWLQGPAGKDYDPIGINRLISAVKADSFFSTCPEAKGLELGFFQKKGEIQVADELSKHLAQCGS